MWGSAAVLRRIRSCCDGCESERTDASQEVIDLMLAHLERDKTWPPTSVRTCLSAGGGDGQPAKRRSVGRTGTYRPTSGRADSPDDKPSGVQVRIGNDQPGGAGALPRDGGMVLRPKAVSRLEWQTHRANEQNGLGGRGVVPDSDLGMEARIMAGDQVQDVEPAPGLHSGLFTSPVPTRGVAPSILIGSTAFPQALPPLSPLLCATISAGRKVTAGLPSRAAFGGEDAGKPESCTGFPAKPSPQRRRLRPLREGKIQDFVAQLVCAICK